MNAAKMILASTVLAAAFGLALGLMSTTAQAHCKRNHQLPHEHCLPSDGTTYTVQLFERDLDTDGAFCLDVFGLPKVCGPVDAIAASNGALLVGDTAFDVLELNRPDDGANLDETWDGVFATCPGLFDGVVNSLFVESWRVNSQGDNVTVQFIRAETPGIGGVPVEVRVQLRAGGGFDFDADPFLPEPPNSVTYNLDDYSISGTSLRGTHPRLRCDNTGEDTLVSGIDLVITATAP